MVFADRDPLYVSPMHSSCVNITLMEALGEVLEHVFWVRFVLAVCSQTICDLFCGYVCRTLTCPMTLWHQTMEPCMLEMPMPTPCGNSHPPKVCFMHAQSPVLIYFGQLMQADFEIRP